MMSDRQRHAVTLRRQGLSYGDIAAKLEISVAQVRYALRRSPDAPTQEEVQAARPASGLTPAQRQARAKARERHEASKALVRPVCECPRRILAAPGTFAAAFLLCSLFPPPSILHSSSPPPSSPYFPLTPPSHS